ncbi:hypothetical protein K7X08_010477 [Anisodus acutangulus]|uniref:Uncharacterized protein n=1 Tax=Anisodus acutangulus TaxID=402998 RepID=A0A9Q1RV61_9SOLA|nr:hypothetical protein K7X08_010477 [Anisodus acutangulus]
MVLLEGRNYSGKKSLNSNDKVYTPGKRKFSPGKTKQCVEVAFSKPTEVLVPTKNFEDLSKPLEGVGTQSPDGVGIQSTEGVERVLWSDQMEEDEEDGEISGDKSQDDSMTSSHQVEKVENDEGEVNKADESLKDINPDIVNIVVVFEDPNAHVKDQVVTLVQGGVHGNAKVMQGGKRVQDDSKDQGEYERTYSEEVNDISAKSTGITTGDETSKNYYSH